MIDKSVRGRRAGGLRLSRGRFVQHLFSDLLLPPPCFVLCCLPGLYTHQSAGEEYSLPISLLLICLWTFLTYSYLVTMISIKFLRAP